MLVDVNEDVWEDPVLAMATQTGLTDMVTTQHGDQAPNMHNQGSTPIDGIFVPTAFIPEIHSGYLAFGEGIPSDHRAVWIDIPIDMLGWFKNPTPSATLEM